MSGKRWDFSHLLQTRKTRPVGEPRLIVPLGILSLLAWTWVLVLFLPERQADWGSVALVGFALAGPAFCLGYFTYRDERSRRRVFRLAVLGSWLLQSLFLLFAWSQGWSFLWLVIAFFLSGFGAWLGAYLASGCCLGWWENNAPPPAEIQQEVLYLHQCQIGALSTAPLAKRLFDIALAGGGLLGSLPLWLASLILIWWEDPGPVFFIKNSVGLGGVNIHQFKFRTMVCGAEEQTGPVLAQAEDARVLRIGKLLRKTALDELPQLINILRGEMSFVGPRPQRTVLVHQYLQELPEYAERHRVLPGLAGLAQVAGDYYLTPLQKLRFDRLYIQHASLGFDLKLLALAFLVAFWFRWQKGWSGRISPKLIRWGSAKRSGGR